MQKLLKKGLYAVVTEAGTDTWIGNLGSACFIYVFLFVSFFLKALEFILGGSGYSSQLVESYFHTPEFNFQYHVNDSHL